MNTSSFSADEIMTISAARLLRNGAVCFVGIGLPSKAANLARLTHGPDIVLIYESGPIGAKPEVLPLSIGDGELSITADTTVSTSEIFQYWLQGGRVDVGFLGAAQIDCFANINTTVIGPYSFPKVRWPGAGGAPEIATSAKQVLIVLRQSQQSFVSKVDFVTSIGHGQGVGSPQKTCPTDRRTKRGDYRLRDTNTRSNVPRTDANQYSPGCYLGKSKGFNRMESKDFGPVANYANSRLNRASDSARLRGSYRRSSGTGVATRDSNHYPAPKFPASSRISL
jgi:acyl CoA:acetate/3-ketoacid CoA transferase beta subunit